MNEKEYNGAKIVWATTGALWLVVFAFAGTIYWGIVHRLDKIESKLEIIVRNQDQETIRRIYLETRAEETKNRIDILEKKK